MASGLPPRLLRHTEGNFEVVNTRGIEPDGFDIISYTWGDLVPPYRCELPGVSWSLKIPPRKIEDIKTLMIHENIQYLWVDCVCLHQEDEDEKAAELPNMYNYYQTARKCYILMDMDEVWDPQDIVRDLKFIDHVISHMEGTAVTSESKLTPRITEDLSRWANMQWTFPIDLSIADSAAIDKGVLNCYSTCVGRVKSIFKNVYFTRVWLENWMDLATSTKDKAYKLREWITNCRHETPTSVLSILRVINDDYWTLSRLQIQVQGIDCAKTDIVNGGPSWWRENYRGVSNIFSAISITARKSRERGDIFRGLLGVFSGLFTPDESITELNGDDMGKISLAFFKQLSIKTGYAWTKLATSSGRRGELEWIPVVSNHIGNLMTTDCFSGVIRLGDYEDGRAKTTATTGINGAPQPYMRVRLHREDLVNSRFKFIFHGCNRGRRTTPGFFHTPEIIEPRITQPNSVAGDETGRVLTQCATILGSLMDPGDNVVEYRKRLLEKLRPRWRISDPRAKTTDWIDRCVSGTDWEDPDLCLFKVHNMSENYEMGAMIDCGSRLHNESTANISCTVVVNCGCEIVAPFSLMFEAITAVKGSSLGGTTATLEENTGRIVLKDGLGLVQVGDIDNVFNLVAFQGDVGSYKAHAQDCRSTRLGKPVHHRRLWPKSRALLRQDVYNGLTGMIRDFGFVETGGSGNLLIFKRGLGGPYKIIGACIDESMESSGRTQQVTIQ